MEDIMEHKNVLEAALFISSQPLTLDRLAKISGINSLGHLKELLESLQKDFEGRGLELANTPEGWVMQVRPALLPRVAHLTPYSDLAEGPKRTLALITLKEPVKQSVIIKMQGNKAYSYIKDLIKRGLIVPEKEGHTKILKLTMEFERYFGEEKSRIKEKLQRYMESPKKEGEPVYEDPMETAKEEKYLDNKPAKEKARDSVIKQEAAKQVPESKGDEFNGNEDEEEPDEVEESKKGKKGPAASHDHAFQEIE
jgi:segregation and condensation protein B